MKRRGEGEVMRRGDIGGREARVGVSRDLRC
jgi:hypothetical protein